jgi:hypothetical protein
MFGDHVEDVRAAAAEIEGVHLQVNLDGEFNHAVAIR